MPKDPTGRALQLLSLLQTHRLWRGAELAERLEVTQRTVRRDVDRLRELGYPVDATSGTEGGYRLAIGAHVPPLVLDDDEAVAVAVGLRYAAGAAIGGMEESSLRALTKIEQLLPGRLRRRVSALHSSVTSMQWATAEDVIDDALAKSKATHPSPSRSSCMGRPTRRVLVDAHRLSCQRTHENRRRLRSYPPHASAIPRVTMLANRDQPVRAAHPVTPTMRSTRIRLKG
jgi:biotin operon repressor